MLAAIIKCLIFSVFDVNSWNSYMKTKFPDKYAISHVFWYLIKTQGRPQLDL